MSWRRRMWAAAVLAGAVAGGAQAAGRASGAIAPGMWADLVALDAGHTDLIGRAGDGLLDAWIFAGDDRLVTDTWAAGRHVVEGGRHRHRDTIAGRYRRVMASLGDRL